MKNLVYIDGFAGAGGFRYGLEAAGYTFSKVYFSEIDKYAVANYQYNFKNSRYVGPIEDVQGKYLKQPDLFTFGWPCQDNSIAGKRKGQRIGTRSGLLYEAVRIIHETKVRYFIAENVKGLYSVNGGVDFMQAIEVLTYLSESLPQYELEMQLLNTRWFLPQNRERIYFVGRLRGEPKGEVFPIGETSQKLDGRDTKVANCLQHPGHSGGNYKGMTMIGEIAYPITSSYGKGKFGKSRGTVVSGVMKVANCVTEAGELRRTTCDRDEEGKAIETSLGNRTIRRLTPIECERLQGFPDNWTKYGNFNGDVSEISDTQRYKLMGNAVSTPVVTAIARKLNMG